MDLILKLTGFLCTVPTILVSAVSPATSPVGGFERGWIIVGRFSYASLQLNATLTFMAAVGRKALTLQHKNLDGLPERFKMVLSGLRMEGVPSEVLLLFAERLDVKACGCWHWSGDREKYKYARFHPGAEWATSANSLAHRFSVAVFSGLLVPSDMVVDHLCADRSCVAPHHHEVITFEENIRRGHSRSHANAICSPSYCPPMKTLRSTAEPADSYMERTLKAFTALKAMLIKPLEDERKLFAFSAHVNIDGPEPEARRGAIGNCWLWEGALTGGYGKITTKQEKGVTRMAHRWSYQNFVGTIKGKLTVDHMCEVRSCVRPSHLQLVTGAKNTALALTSAPSINSRKTHCIRGHEYNEENTQFKKTATGTKRICTPCRQQQGIESYERKKSGTQLFKRVEGFCKNGHELTVLNVRITPSGGKVCRKCVANAATARRKRYAAEGKDHKHPRKPRDSDSK